MSLVCPVGPEGNLLAEPGPKHCKRLNITQPVLTLEEMETLKNGDKNFKTAVIDTTFPVGSGPDGLLAVSDVGPGTHIYHWFCSKPHVLSLLVLY